MKRVSVLVPWVAVVGWSWAMSPAAHAADASAPTSWQAAVDTLQEARARGETCASVLKAHGQLDEVVDGRLVYSDARAGFNVYIDDLLDLLEAGKALEIDPSSGLDLATASLDQLCEIAHATLGQGEGSKNVVLEIFKGVGSDVVNVVVDGSTELVRAWAESSRLQQKRIAQRIEDQKWVPFEEVEPAL